MEDAINNAIIEIEASGTGNLEDHLQNNAQLMPKELSTIIEHSSYATVSKKEN